MFVRIKLLTWHTYGYPPSVNTIYMLCLSVLYFSDIIRGLTFR